MEADGHEAAVQPPIQAETDGNEVQHQHSSAMDHELQSLEPPASGSEEVIGGIKDDVAQAGEEAAGPAAKAGSRKRKSAADKAADATGTPTTRRGRSSVGDSTDSPVASSSKKAKGSASKTPQVSTFSFDSGILIEDVLSADHAILKRALIGSLQADPISEYVLTDKDQFGTFIIQVNHP